VLVAGGYYSDSGLIKLAHCEIYDPRTDQWTVTGSLNTARESHVAVLLPDGKVLAAGGYGGNQSAELYDPASGVWSPVTSAMVHERVYHAAVLLPNGKVLIAGGYDSNAELFNPGVNTFTEIADAMADVRAGLTLTLLPNGQVLAAGGYNGTTEVDHAELFDPATGLWDEPVTMNDPHESHAAVALADGSVLIIGGGGNTDPDTYDHYVMTELFNPGLGFQEAGRPQISSLSSQVSFGGAPWLLGSGFLGGGEASAGHTQSASSGYPLVQLYRLDNSQISYLWADPQKAFSDTAFYGKVPSGFPAGPVMMFVYANGIPSVGKITFFQGPQIFLPLIRR